MLQALHNYQWKFQKSHDRKYFFESSPEIKEKKKMNKFWLHHNFNLLFILYQEFCLGKLDWRALCYEHLNTSYFLARLSDNS